MNASTLVDLVIWYAAFLFSTSLHEASHAMAAAYGGDYTAYDSGQATLNPLPHIRRERTGMILAPLLSFFYSLYRFNSPWMIGWASAPFNPVWAVRHPKKSVVMSLAGPLSHLVPVILAWLAMAVALRTGLCTLGYVQGNPLPVMPAADGQPLLAALCGILGVLFQLNLILFAFNLLPIPPMDGSEIWFLFIKREEDRLRWRHIFSSYNLAGIMLAWYVFPRVFSPVNAFAVKSLFRVGLGW